MFEEKYRQLNDAQKAAVDKVDGPLMVVAGPGTGKTQLLSMRVANILRQTDMHPGNILCLTFTDAASTNMTERMANGLFGADAYKVPVFTFHAFCQHVIDRYPEYFFNGAIYHAADEITQAEIVADILRKLPHTNRLSSFYGDEFLYLNAAINAISDIKRAGLVPKDVEKVLAQNEHFIRFANQFLTHFFVPVAPRKQQDIQKYLKHFKQAQHELKRYVELARPDPVPPLSHIIITAMQHAIDETERAQVLTTKFITDFRKRFLEKDARGKHVLIDSRRSERTSELVEVYNKYLDEMGKRKLFDFDDMILRVVLALKLFPQLKFNLQEQFQYILVDEFQDTNDAQMQILRHLTDYDKAPNIMVVGDFKQAIYRFQGAEVANIEKFAKQFGDELTTIELEENYRSTDKILRVADKVISQSGKQVFFDQFKQKLHANSNDPTTVEEVLAQDWSSELSWVAGKIAGLLEAGAKPEEIAVIAKKHKHLADLVPFLQQKGVSVQYDREQDTLSSPPVEQLLLMARACVFIARQEFAKANELIPRILAHPAWGISSKELWQLSIEAQYQNWLTTMLDQDIKLADISAQIIALAKDTQNTTFEESLDLVFEPYKKYYFSPEKLEEDPETYLDFLSDLTTIRQLAREYKGKENLKLADFIDLVDTYKKVGREIKTVRRYRSGSRVQLLSAHGAKGLEFDTVFIINGTRDVWCKGFGGGRNNIKFPSNMPLSTDDSEDEQVRLLYVAITRARNNLFISTHKFNESCKEVLPCSYITGANIKRVELPLGSTCSLIEDTKTRWYTSLTKVDSDLKDILSSTLDSYRLSATHLNTFIDLEYGGPEAFLMNILLKFPSAKWANASYGTAVHSTIKQIHTEYATKKRLRSISEVLKDFETELKKEHLGDIDFKYYLKKGHDSLKVFVKQFKFEPEQIAERSFKTDNVVWQGVRLSGTVDMLVKNEKLKTITIYDYKTGKPYANWEKNGKLHKYSQQLMFYKLLVENSSEFAGYTVDRGVLQFVEPLDGQIVNLETDYSDEEALERFGYLVKAVWRDIQALNLPDTSTYTKDMFGTMNFENFLIRQF
ncbi:MAG: ATP-dependent helicase [Candidatus Nomurabacteria bacterium]|jgi:DNA helicase-2/ATP-dependent DNA helicase PcrA|nr:ATP-dependent helicase [Candidatus Nomurabacteria bacterium]